MYFGQGSVFRCRCKLGPALGSSFRGGFHIFLALEGAVAPALRCSTPLRPLGFEADSDRRLLSQRFIMMWMPEGANLLGIRRFIARYIRLYRWTV